MPEGIRDAGGRSGAIQSCLHSRTHSKSPHGVAASQSKRDIYPPKMQGGKTARCALKRWSHPDRWAIQSHQMPRALRRFCGRARRPMRTRSGKAAMGERQKRNGPGALPRSRGDDGVVRALTRPAARLAMTCVRMLCTGGVPRPRSPRVRPVRKTSAGLGRSSAVPPAGWDTSPSRTSSDKARPAYTGFC